ncbi:MAG: gliding motility-associated C-terminal domain-containing protein [Bacteroidales bacterium]
MRLPYRILQRLLWILPVYFIPLLAHGQQLAIDSVTVQPETGYVEIYWSWEGDAPETTFRIIRYGQGKYDIIVDDLPASTRTFVDRFEDGTPNASNRQVKYWVTVLVDRVSITSSHIHGTLFLNEGEIDVCGKKLSLSWKNYSINRSQDDSDPLPVDFESVEILTSLNGATYTIEEQVEYGPENFILHEVEPGNYSIIIRAQSSGVSSTSNARKVDFSALTLPEFPPYIRSVDIIDDQLVQISLIVDNTVVSPSYVISRSESASGVFEPLDTIASDQQDFSYEDPVANPHARQWFYQVEMLDSCGIVKAESQTASTLFLKARQQDVNTNVLEWEHQPGWGGGVEHYEILRKLPGEDQFIQVAQTGAVTRYEDDLRSVADEMRSGVIHYQVAGHEGGGDAFEIQASVVSNIVTLVSEETIFVPNAFRPSSSKAENQVFKPAMVAVSDNGYQLLVFNRWGEQIFMSPVPEEGWDGTAGSEQSPAGVYAWVLRYKDGNGQQKEKRGVVTLIR